MPCPSSQAILSSYTSYASKEAFILALTPYLSCLGYDNFSLSSSVDASLGIPKGECQSSEGSYSPLWCSWELPDQTFLGCEVNLFLDIKSRWQSRTAGFPPCFTDMTSSLRRMSGLDPTEVTQRVQQPSALASVLQLFLFPSFKVSSLYLNLYI